MPGCAPDRALTVGLGRSTKPAPIKRMIRPSGHGAALRRDSDGGTTSSFALTPGKQPLLPLRLIVAARAMASCSSVRDLGRVDKLPPLVTSVSARPDTRKDRCPSCTTARHRLWYQTIVGGIYVQNGKCSISATSRILKDYATEKAREAVRRFTSMKDRMILEQAEVGEKTAFDLDATPLT